MATKRKKKAAAHEEQPPKRRKRKPAKRKAAKRKKRKAAASHGSSSGAKRARKPLQLVLRVEDVTQRGRVEPGTEPVGAAGGQREGGVVVGQDQPAPVLVVPEREFALG